MTPSTLYKINLPKARHKVIDGFLFHWVANRPQAPYLLFIPGACHGAWCYENYFSYFHGLGYNVASVDLPNRGGMSMGDDFFTLSIDRIAKTLTKAIAITPCIDSFVAVGHSLGALMAGVLATQSDCISGLILLTPSPPGNMATAQKIPLIKDTQTPFKFINYDLAVQRFWADIDDTETQKALFDKLNGESPNIMNERYALTVSVPWTPHKCPALVIEAELDHPETHPPMQDRRVAEFYQADYIFMKNTAHCLMVSPHWQEGADHIHTWLHNNKLSPL